MLLYKLFQRPNVPQRTYGTPIQNKLHKRWIGQRNNADRQREKEAVMLTERKTRCKIAARKFAHDVVVVIVA